MGRFAAKDPCSARESKICFLLKKFECGFAGRVFNVAKRESREIPNLWAIWGNSHDVRYWANVASLSQRFTNFLSLGAPISYLAAIYACSVGRRKYVSVKTEYGHAGRSFTITKGGSREIPI